MISRDWDREDRTSTMSSARESEEQPRSTGQVEGVVFCGGKSRRMGTDKAELETPGRIGITLLENAIAILDGVADSVVLATGEAPRYESLGRACVLDREAGAGPLAGLASALARTEATWLCALACDMPDVDSHLFAGLLKYAMEHDLDACLLETSGGVEPLCAVYRNTCREAVRRALDRGERKMVSFHESELRVGTLDAAALTGSDDCAKNLNTRADYARVVESERPRNSGGESS